MKQTIYIDSALTPRYSATGWPEKPSIIHYEEMQMHHYEKAIAKAKAESIEFESHAIFYPDLKLSTTPDSFINVEIGEVEVVDQMANSSNGKGWFDCPRAQWKYSPGFPTRTVARLKKPENSLSTPNNPCKHCGALENQDCQHGGGECPWADEAAEQRENAGHGYSEGAEIVDVKQYVVDTKARILEAYKELLDNCDPMDFSHRDALSYLSEVLDDLKIK